MESAAERKSIYQELLTESFEHLVKQLPKLSKTAIQQLLDQLKEDQELNANKYFGIYKLAIGTKDPKAISLSLDAIDKLVNTGFLDGNCEESSIDLDLDKSKEGDKTPKDARESKRKLIDTIIETVCSCKRERSDDIQKQLINVLTIIATKLKNIVHGNNLQRILETLSHVYTVSRSQDNQGTAKSSLKLIVTTVFQRVDKIEHNQAGDSTSKNRKKGDFEASFTEGPSKILSNRLSPDTTSQITNVNDNKVYEEEIKHEEVKQEETHATEENITKETEDDTTKNANNQKDGLFKNYVSRYVTNLVDDVCMYNAKVEQVGKKYEGKEESDKENFQHELNDIPLKAIPLASDIEDPRYKILRKVKIENEAGTPAGVFGWCFICRSSASLFCKDTKVPVCSLDCKFKHLEEADFLNNANKGKDFGSKNLDEVQDAYQVFGYLCRLSSKEQGKENAQEINRLKALALELLLAAMANPSAIFSARKEFRDSIKEYLCTSVLKNSVSNDKVIFSYSLGLFNSLINHFRDFLKAEMALFIDTIFFNMLESGNSNYQQRMSALQVFYKICSKANIILDFYVNYDCDTDSNNIVERMVELLCKIAQGKFARPEYSTVIQPAQDQNLRFIALGALVNLVKALVVFTEDHNRQVQNALKKITPADGMKEEDDKDITMEVVDLPRNENYNQLDEIGKARYFKNELQKAVHKFNFKIKLGMRMFTQLGVINPEDARSVARFFKKTPNLSHEKLGEYFGDEHDFNIRVLTEFTELIDFRNKTLDDGLRFYLKHFQLPGEGQKIDRVMQAFAGKYYKDNPTSFSSSTTAYTLSFLFMMLQTDAHNPQVKPEDKMKLESFISLARGMDDGRNLPPEELTGYYNRIIQNPLGLHAADRAKKMVADAQNISLKKKEEQFKMESDKMIKEGQRLIKGTHQSKQYHTVRNTECIKPLFHEVVWSPVLAVFSVLLEQSEDTNMIQSCLDGFANCIILTGLHNMSVERDTFVSSLAKFTNILTIREIKEKNIKCIKLLLDLATNRGNLLRSSWRYVLECIVWIDYYFHYSPQHSRASDLMGSKSGKNISNELEQTEQANSEIVQQIVDLNVINVIFSKSATFDIEEITDFITCLCQISDEELRGKGANTFCLQKLVEVAHFNMDGIKFIWSRIWNIMREHISNVALTSKPEVSLFAIDLLKQLSIKFLGQKELGLLEFQKDFLKPFETIFQKTKNDDMKELILSCCNYIISHTKRDLKSGWKSIIDILGLAADSEDSHLSKIAFQITESMLQDDIKLLHDSVSDFTILLLKFARSKKQDVAEISIKHLKSFLHQSIVIEHEPATPKETETHDIDSDHNTTIIEEPTHYQNITIHGLPENTWISILTSIITLASDSSARIQNQSTMLLFDLIEQYGSGFPPSFWNMVLSGVIKPLFDEIQYSLPSARNTEKAGAFREFYEKSFERFIDIYSIYFVKLSQFNVELFNIIFNGIQNQSQIIGKVAANALKYMIFKDQNLRVKGLDIIYDLFTRLCSNTSLTHVLNSHQDVDKEITDLNIKKEGVIEYKEWKLYPLDCDVQCRTQLLLVEIIKDVTEKFFAEFDQQQISKLKTVVRTIWKLSQKFNQQTYLRYCLSKCGFMRDRADKNETPDLLELERESLAVYSSLLFNLFSDKNSTDPEKALEEFINMGLEITQDFQQRNEKLLALSKTDLRKIGSGEGQNEVEDQPSGEENITDEEYKKQAARIKKASLEKEILSLRTALYNEFLVKQEKLDTNQIQGRLQEVTKSIIDGVICFIPKENEEYAEVLRKILTRYFDYSYDKSNE